MFVIGLIFSAAVNGDEQRHDKQLLAGDTAPRSHSGGVARDAPRPEWGIGR
jgi:hypothetical protein